MPYSGGMTDSGSHSERAPRRQLWVRMAVPALATLLLLIGIVLMLLPAEQATIGWFAYQPLPQTVLLPDAGLVLTARRILGIALASIGALTLAFLCGWALARRSSRANTTHRV